MLFLLDMREIVDEAAIGRIEYRRHVYSVTFLHNILHHDWQFHFGDLHVRL